MRKKEFFRLTPFKMQVLQSFPFIDADFDALTNYELLCKVVEYLNITVDNVNLLSDDFKTLYDYVHNLDLQDEVNTKLDEMAESGELAEIIAQYLELAGILAYNTLNDLKNASNIANGSFTKTYGNISYNDGYGAFYKIRELVNTDVIDNDNLVALTNYPTLVAEKINNRNIDDLENVKYFNMKPLQNIVMDSYGYLQGCCSDGTNIYSYNTEEAVNGKLYKFNPKTHKLLESFTAPLHHGNSMTYINGLIYAIQFQTDSNVYSTAIDIYDIANNTTTSIDPLNNESLHRLTGIAKYSDNELLIVGNTTSARLLSETKWFIYNISTQNYYELTLDLNNFGDNPSDTVIADIEYYKNKVLVLTSKGTIYLFNKEYNTIKLESQYVVNEKYDMIGNEYGEFEGLTLLDNYPDGTFWISSRIQRANELQYDNTHGQTIKGYLINLTTNLAPDYPILDGAGSLGYRYQVQLNDTNKYDSNRVLLELGTTTNPFTDLIRAVSYVCNELLGQGNIQITNNGTYFFNHQFGKNFNLQHSNQPTIILDTLTDCNITIFTNDTTKPCIIKGLDNVMNLNACTLNITGATLKSGIQGARKTIINLGSCTFNPDSNIANAITLQDGCKYYGGINNATNFTTFLNLSQRSIAFVLAYEAGLNNVVNVGSSLITQGIYVPDTTP